MKMKDALEAMCKGGKQADARLLRFTRGQLLPKAGRQPGFLVFSSLCCGYYKEIHNISSTEIDR